MSSTAEQITELSAKIHAAEQKAASSTETDRARLAELERQAGAEAEAEQHRRATRRQAWARHYLQSGDHQAAEAQARQDVTAARRAFEQTIAAEPWVVALIGWQAAVNAQHAVTRRGEYAREITRSTRWARCCTAWPHPQTRLTCLPRSSSWPPSATEHRATPWPRQSPATPWTSPTRWPGSRATASAST